MQTFEQLLHVRCCPKYLGLNIMSPSYQLFNMKHIQIYSSTKETKSLPLWNSYCSRTENDFDRLHYGKKKIIEQYLLHDSNL